MAYSCYICNKRIYKKDIPKEYFQKISIQLLYHEECLEKGINNKPMADNKRVIKDFEMFQDSYQRIANDLQTLRRVFSDNELNKEVKQTDDMIRMLSHQYHKSKYPNRYQGDLQIC